jgi:hypothetical protein
MLPDFLCIIVLRFWYCSKKISVAIKILDGYKAMVGAGCTVQLISKPFIRHIV